MSFGYRHAGRTCFATLFPQLIHAQHISSTWSLFVIPDMCGYLRWFSTLVRIYGGGYVYMLFARPDTLFSAFRRVVPRMLLVIHLVAAR